MKFILFLMGMFFFLAPLQYQRYWKPKGLKNLSLFLHEKLKGTKLTQSSWAYYGAYTRKNNKQVPSNTWVHKLYINEEKKNVEYIFPSHFLESLTWRRIHSVPIPYYFTLKLRKLNRDGLNNWICRFIKTPKGQRFEILFGDEKEFFMRREELNLDKVGYFENDSLKMIWGYCE